MYVVGVSACPTGVAHTYLAAEALTKAFKAKNHQVKIETQGASGIENEITPEDVEKADFVILTKDIAIKGEKRFEGKKIVRVMSGVAIQKANGIVKKLEEIQNNQNK
ncbi:MULTISPECIES: PTS fructose transporter subunit IIB [unclassified Sporolactobacillus]|uniref:PTS fructose transporter subunit IIB n=1 Tax=unclassified Sporolactobacillus TaxID=2628533 RepID=UPI00236874BA|nr:PTS fructose transporter subunit IIB [Sporolactobacillus sp. CQH2019]MDD9149850.1 PTS fructose transporter subunit IIB [Sporolactobacillus sp. CQH2019]